MNRQKKKAKMYRQKSKYKRAVLKGATHTNMQKVWGEEE